uniref:Uncharacterized protein n=1 Tax=Sphaerodactylus townsendi TaxID=933632 RepID=A0ACB8F9R2_9SAUR
MCQENYQDLFSRNLSSRTDSLSWGNLSNGLQVIHNLQVHHNPDHKKNKTNNSGPFTGDSPNTPELQQPIFLHWNKGKVVALYENKATSPLTLELKRGLASLLQFQTHSGKETEIFEVLWQPTSKSVYSVDGSLLKSALAEENHVISLSLRSSIGVNITSRQYLELVTQKPGSKELSGISLQEALAAILEKPQPTDIASEPSKRICTQCPTLKNYLKSLVKKKFKMDVSKASTTWKFHRVVQMLRDANKKDIVVLLKKAPQNMVPFYVDAALAVQSTASLMALSEFLDFGNERQTPLLEKFLFGAAVSPRPSKELFRLVLDKMKRKTVDPIIWETGNLVIGTLVGKLCRMKLCELQSGRLLLQSRRVGGSSDLRSDADYQVC